MEKSQVSIRELRNRGGDDIARVQALYTANAKNVVGITGLDVREVQPSA